jgi:photosynthetic reaction center cytochrome c subunit
MRFVEIYGRGRYAGRSLEPRMMLFRIAGLLILSLLSISIAYGQVEPRSAPRATTGTKPLMAEEVFKNVQVLKGISVKEFLETMGFFAASTPYGCGACHGYTTGGSWESYAEDTPMKKTTRKMIRMMDAINRTYFKGARGLSCYSCHRNADTDGPKFIPSLADQYGVPAPADPEEIPEQAAGAPSPDQVLEKYIEAVGGAEKLANFTSFVAKGTYQGYDDPGKNVVEIYAKAPGQFFQVVHGYNGDSTWVDDGRLAWVAQSERDAPAPVLALAAGDLDGAHLEAALYFPAHIRQLLNSLKVGFPISGVASILSERLGAGVDDRELIVMQGITAAGNNVKLYFDENSGLLVRTVRYTKLPVGWAPTQIDFADYRDVSGIKMPFRITKTWVDGRSVIELTSIEVNIPIPAAKFERPAPPLSSN